MSETQMNLPYDANDLQFFAKMKEAKKERFVALCNQWGSARELCDDLAKLPHIVCERKVAGWRNREFKRVPYNDVLAVKLAAEKRLLSEANRWAKSLKEAAEL